MSIARILTVTLVFCSLLLIVAGNKAGNPGKPSNPGNPQSNQPNPGDGGLPTPEQVNEYVEAHNRVRTGKGAPPLTWDNELAKASKSYALERKDDCKMEHSTSPFGENLFWGGRDHWTPTKVVKEWADEAQFYDEKANTCKPGEMCGHYTQIIWKDTQRVGCAKQKCTHQGWYFVCSYDPPGNYAHELPLGGPAP